MLSIKYHITTIHDLNYNNVFRVEMYEPVKEKVEGDNLDTLLVQNFAMITPIFTGIAVLLNTLIFGKVIFYHVNLVPFILFLNFNFSCISSRATTKIAEGKSRTTSSCSSKQELNILIIRK